MNHKQIVERETSEYIQLSQSREEHLHRTRQLKHKLSHCAKSNYLKHDEESDMDDTEEVIYSEGEPFEGYQYPNNTWDSDDSIYMKKIIRQKQDGFEVNINTFQY